MSHSRAANNCQVCVCTVPNRHSKAVALALLPDTQRLGYETFALKAYVNNLEVRTIEDHTDHKFVFSNDLRLAREDLSEGWRG